jgi:GT2 family glycosyltransferase
VNFKVHDIQASNIGKNGDSARVAVLIPTVAESTLEEVIRRTREELPSAEIILISSDPVHVLAKKHSARFLEFSERTWKPIGINVAVSETGKEWFVIVDADAIPQKGWGKSMLNAFSLGHSFFTGSVDLSAGNYWMRAYNLSLLHEFSTGKPPSNRKHIPAISMGFTREFFDKNGPLLETINRSEDYEWSLRAFKNGLTPFFTPEPVVKHVPVNKSTFRDFWKFWYLSGPDNIRIRHRYASTVKTPFFMKSPWFILVFSPILALIPTLRIFKTSPKLIMQNLELLPAIYLSKFAWCLGVFHYRKTI